MKQLILPGDLIFFSVCDMSYKFVNKDESMLYNVSLRIERCVGTREPSPDPYNNGVEKSHSQLYIYKGIKMQS